MADSAAREVGMPFHVLRKDEHIHDVAARHGLTGKVVWEAPENSGLRDRRKDMNVLEPGDRLFVPAKRTRHEQGATEARHRFRRRGTPIPIRVKFADDFGEPLDNERYVLTVDGVEHAVGSTDEDGVVEAKVPATARVAEVELVEAGERMTLRIGGLDPITKISGVQQRLTNLLFDPGPIDGKLGPRTVEAIRAFQRTRGLEPTGLADEQTRGAIEAAHEGRELGLKPEDSQGAAARVSEARVATDAPESDDEDEVTVGGEYDHDEVEDA